jgi:ABC-type dipeptide/oligopeptide/nickel transport system permease component
MKLTLTLIMTAMLVYTYLGYGLVIWMMLKIRKFKDKTWTTHK